MATLDLPDFANPQGNTYTKLFQSFVGTSGTSLSVGSFESVIVLLGNINNTSLLVGTYQFIDSASGFIVDSGCFSADDVTSDPNWPSWTLAVKADTLKVFGVDGNVIGVIIGTNITSPKKLNNDLYPARHFQGTVPASSTNGTLVQLVGTDTINNKDIPLTNCSNYNGTVTASTVGSGAINGQVQFGFRDGAGVLQRGTVLNNPATTIQLMQVGHPYAYTSWWFLVVGTSPASAVAVLLTVCPSTPSP